MDANIGDFENYLDELERRLDIVEVIQRDEPLRQEGRGWRGLHNHSLQVSPDVGLWRDWGESHAGGDVVRWVELRRKLPFKIAVEELARLAGMEPPPWGRQDSKAVLAAHARYAVFDVARNFYVKKRRECAAASRYCSRRGWVATTLDKLHIGYFDGDYDGLRNEFKMYSIDQYSPEAVALVGYRGDVTAWAKAHDVDLEGRQYWVGQGYIPGLPKDVLIFPHIELGRVRYISTRSVCMVREEEGAFIVWDATTDTETRYSFSNDEERKAAEESARKHGKRHHNLPKELAGPRIPYWGAEAVPGRSPVVVVEGQADVVTLEQWGIPAVALAGCQPDETAEGLRLLHYLADAQRKESQLWIGTDSDDAGATGARKLAAILGPLLRIVPWPAHDANDWLQVLAADRAAVTDPTADELAREASAAAATLEAAQPYLLLWAGRVGALPDHDRVPQLDALAAAMAKLSDAEIINYEAQVAKAAGLSKTNLEKLIKAKKDAEKDDDGEKRLIELTTAGGFIQGALIEMLYVPPAGMPANAIIMAGGKTLLAVRDAQGNVSVQPHWDVSDLGYRLLPLSADSALLRENKLILARNVGELLAPQELVRRVRALIHKYVDIPEFYECLSAYYVLFSWFYDIFPTLSYLRVKGDPGTGKTRFIEVIGSFCYRPLIMNGGCSVSAIFRSLDSVRGTLVLDEGDFAKSDESAEITKLLTVGNQRRQGHIARAGSKENDFEPEFYNVYGPKVISTRKEYHDEAIGTRCLTHETGSPTTRTDIPTNLPDSFWTEEVPAIQALLLAYRLHHWSTDINLREIPLDETVDRRIQQVTDSLKKMIDDPAMTKDLQAFIRAYNAEMIKRRGMQTEAKILEALLILWETQTDKPEDKRDLSVGTIAAIANDLIDFENGNPIDQWSRYKDKDRSKALSPRGAGNYLDKLQLETHRPSTDRRFHVLWDQKRIEGLWQRYGLDDADTRQAVVAVWYDIQALVEERANRLKSAVTPPSYQGK